MERIKTSTSETQNTQFTLFCKTQYHKLQICLKGLYNLYTYNIPDPGQFIFSKYDSIHLSVPEENL